MILDLSESKQPEVGRWIGSRMIAIIAPILKDKLEGPLLDRARALCSDSDEEVRETVAEIMLKALLDNLSLRLISCYLVQKIFELLYDSNMDVRKKMIGTFYQMMHKFPKEDMNVNMIILP